MFDLLIKNTKIIDGTGQPAFYGSVASRSGLLTILPADTKVPATEVIDGTGKTTCPGFIDAHSHGDITIGQKFASLAKISQGVTSQVTGMCGLSLFPVDPNKLKALQESLSPQTEKFPDEMGTFTNCESFLHFSNALPQSINTFFLVGHSSLRIAAMGFEDRKPTAIEMQKMKGMLREAMEAGAMGLSSGLIYIPSTYADSSELIELCKIVDEYGGIYTTHLRSESTKCLESVAEAIEVAQKSGVRLHISHHKIAGQKNWGNSKHTLKMIDQANDAGISVSCDQYPYTFCMTHLCNCMPPKYFTEGFSAAADFLKDPITREHIRNEMSDPENDYDNFYLNSGGWEGVYLVKSPKLAEAEKMTISEYANNIGIDPFDAFCKIMIANNGLASAIYFSMCDDDLFKIIQNCHTVVGTDGILRSMDDYTHPRSYGSFPHAIRTFVKENKIFSMEEMIQKMTSSTANIYKIKNKGIIMNNYDSDIVVFDEDKLLDLANFEHPLRLSTGIDYVVVNGKVAYCNKNMTIEKPGKIIRFNR